MANKTRLITRGLLVVLVAAAGGLLPKATGLEPSVGHEWADFDGDGVGDLVIGVPGERINGKPGAGAVHVLFSGGGAGSQFWHQNSPGIAGVAEPGDGFGWSVAAGDFNGDGVDDLAIGVPNEDLGKRYDAGVVHMLLGVESVGLRSVGSRILAQGSVAIGGNVESGDQFGWSLAAGDYNGDGVDDLAVGVPGEGLGSVAHTGVIQILPGDTDFGLSGSGGATIGQSTAGVPGSNEKNDRFGWSLASGQFGGSGHDDLAVGAPLESIGSKARAGAVWSFLGSSGGIRANTAHIMTEDTVYTPPEADTDDMFGYALAAGDIDPGSSGGAFDELAIGAPGNLKRHPGAVTIVRGSDNGFVAVGEIWYQGKGGPNGGALGGTRQTGDRFGWDLTMNDFNDDGAADLAIGVPGENVSPHRDPGVVQILYSNGDELDPLVGPTQTFSQNSPGVPGKNEHDDMFGESLSSGDFDGDGVADLVVATPFEDFGGADAGAAWIFYADPNEERITGSGSRLFTQDTQGIADFPERNDFFGASLS